ncbi:MAG: nuclear transport factor 2 family protein [Saprospiraceae bacterium]|nr:nuclear transport factor 2 family protein [Saprospiraceae bacterium]
MQICRDGRQSIAALSAGDADGFVAGYADNAVYMFNNGDSLAGKAAIAEYWKRRK